MSVVAGSYTATVAADDIAGVHYQRSKISIGADGSAIDLAYGQGTMANSLPVAIASDQGAVPASQSGTWNVGTVTTVTAVTSLTNALPAGTNAIGKLAANSGVDIGDVDVTSVVTGTGATNLGKAEDAVHTSGDVGVAALAVRNDTLDALAGADSDYIPLTTDAVGALWSRETWKTPLGDTMVDDAASFDALRVTPISVVTVQGKTQTIKEFTFLDADGAQTNVALVTVAAGSYIRVTSIDATCDNANTADVGVRVGFAAATLPAGATTGATGIVLSHAGISPGGGIVKNYTGSAVEGADGEDLRITSEDPVGGALRLVVAYEVLTT